MPQPHLLLHPSRPASPRHAGPPSPRIHPGSTPNPLPAPTQGPRRPSHPLIRPTPSPRTHLVFWRLKTIEMARDLSSSGQKLVRMAQGYARTEAADRGKIVQEYVVVAAEPTDCRTRRNRGRPKTQKPRTPANAETTDTRKRRNRGRPQPYKPGTFENAETAGGWDSLRQPKECNGLAN